MQNEHKLDVGQSIYLDCPHCGAEKKYGLTRTQPNKYIYHCFKCEASGAISPRKVRITGNVSKPKPASIPDNAEYNPAYWPKEAKAWVGDLLPDAVKAKFYYDPNSDRIVTPYFDNDGLLWTNARALDPEQKPKYLLRKAERMGTDRPIFIPDWEPNQVLVLVEDVLSCLRVRQIEGVQGVACMGTTLSDTNLSKVKYLQPSRVLVFFDNDNSLVKKKQELLRKKLELYLTCDVKVVRQDRDPKEFTREELECLMLNY